MFRKITSKYPGRCAKCGNAISRGDLIYWERGNRSIFHSGCFGSSPEPKIEPRGQWSPQDQVRSQGDVKTPEIKLAEPAKAGQWDFTINIADLKARYREVLTGDTSCLNAANLQASSGAHLTNPTSWNGFTRDQMLGWLKNGYKTEAFQDLHEMSPPMRKRRKMIYQDEGEIQVDLALSGYDQPFLAWTKRESAPGLSIDVVMVFSAFVSSDVIADYQRWIARALYTLETEGIDLEVNLATINGGPFSDRNRDENVTVRVNVKKEQEASDFNRWSVMFSPGGYRGLVFMAQTLGAMHHDKVMNSGYGAVRSKKWDIEFNPETRKMRITCDAAGSRFPAEEMSAKLRAILQQFK